MLEIRALTDTHFAIIKLKISKLSDDLRPVRIEPLNIYFQGSNTILTKWEPPNNF